ncbi:hypothetical protein MXB_45 [Myxobolus squamalis]|nr:hypothetical protein MXB_45 [Myxobolus squamalis]
MRTSMSVLILAMVKLQTSTRLDKSKCDLSTNHSGLPFVPLLKYSSSQEAFILAAYFYGYFVMNAPASLLVHLYGPRKVMFISLAGATLFTFLLVPASKIQSASFYLISATRIAVGISCGGLYASVQVLLANWVPPYQKTILPVAAHSGNIIGLMLALSAGVFIDTTIQAWEYYTYASGVLGIVSLSLWAVFVYDHPWEHPFISDEEKRMLMEKLHPDGIPRRENFQDIPFKAIFSSPHLYLTSLAHLGNNFVLYMLLTNHPKYIKTEYGGSHRDSCLIPIIAFAANALAQIPFSIVTQYAQNTIRKPETYFRKINGLIATVLSSIFLLPIGFTGCSLIKSEALIVLSMVVLAGNSNGFIVGMINLSKKHAGLVMGFSNSIASISGFISPAMVSWYKDSHNIHEAWTYSFITTAALNFTGGMIWFIFGSCEPQHWGNHKLASDIHVSADSFEIKEPESTA